MNGFAFNEVFTNTDIRSWHRATKLVGGLPKDLRSKVRCHELARAVRKFMALGGYAYVADGKCGIVDHSWIQLKPETILDVYTVGRLPMVQLVHVSAASLVRGPTGPGHLYQPGPMRDDIDEAVVNDLAAQFAKIAERFILRHD